VLVLFACTLQVHRSAIVLTARPTNRTCVAPPRPTTSVEVTRAYPALHFDQPTSLVATPDGAGWYLAERGGRVWRFSTDDATPRAEVALDLRKQVDASSEAVGLLSITVHPTNGDLFASYTAPGGTLTRSKVSRFHSDDGGKTFARASEQRIVELDQISAYHVNTDLDFGRDGYLYVGFGDGGPHGDPLGRAQDPNSLRGSILRLDVDHGVPYSIPADNPFAGGGGAPEVWAYGLRNPWRFAFDRQTGELWAGDVGNDHMEEIDRIVPGGNYGWPIREGTRCMKTSPCTSPKFTEPHAAYWHSAISSVTFGVIYRGAAMPDLAGHLIFGDYASGGVWALDPAAESKKPRILANEGQMVASFAEDVNGEPVIVDYRGMLWRLGPATTRASDVPTLLSQTGCFDRGGAPARGMIAYDVNVPFWSDGAAKRRWLALPDGTKATIAASGHLELPIGSVVAKEFSIDGARIETRLLVRHDDGGWAGYTYQWNRAQSDATLIPNSTTRVSSKQPTWTFPHRGDCMRCHQAAAGHTLGLERAQLDLALDRETNQHEMLARAWLHANCAYCHRPGANGQGELDLRYDTPLAQMNVCNIKPTFDMMNVPNAMRIAPGEPERSLLFRRIRATGFSRMPPLGLGTRGDPDGLALVGEWIGSLTSCR
jgi:glucose/arabinose dehydrogenase